MKAKFWGVRGSIPTPLTNNKLRSRIAAVVHRIKQSDLGDLESRESFLQKLPPYLFGEIGGNTTCLEVLSDDDNIIVIDGGSGIRELGTDIIKTRDNQKIVHIFFTHFHYDHLQGLPFFQPILTKGYEVNFYSPVKNFEMHIRNHMKPPYFPVEMDILPATFKFHILKQEYLLIGNTNISWRRMKHPQGSYSYRFSRNGKVIIFATDSEITEKEFIQSEKNKSYFEGADVLIQDSQYTLEESINKIDWGHTSYSMAVDLATQWRIKNLFLFHHEPMYSDKKILGILNSAQWYVNHMEDYRTEVFLAKEGEEISV